MVHLRRFWHAFKDIAVIFSFVVNFVLVVILLVISIPALRATLALKSGTVEPLLNDLDAAFVQLGESKIDTTIAIDQCTPISFTLPLSEPLDIDFTLDIQEHTAVVLQEPVPLNGLPARFNLPGGGGMINGSVSLSLPAGLRLPVWLDMSVPVRKTIPVRMEVPVDQQVNIVMDVPVQIHLGEAGLAPAVEELRAVFRPVRVQIERLPDGVEFGPR
jgi:hypothetical protein